jgi:hypothetical protein
MEPNYRPAEMLLGFAIENALKGLMIAHDPALTSEEKLAKTLLEHDLCVLAACANVTVTAAENAILEALTCLVVWAGRYPTPTRLSSRMSKRAKYAHADTALAPARDHAAVLALCGRLLQELGSHDPSPRPQFDIVVAFKEPP